MKHHKKGPCPEERSNERVALQSHTRLQGLASRPLRLIEASRQAIASRSGFTLMEILIVVGLIGILLAIAAVSYSSAQKKSRDSRRMSDLQGIRNAMEQYYADHSGVYPTAVAELTSTSTYLPSGWPKDPKTGTAYSGVTFPTSGFCVCVDLEGTTTGGNSSNATCGFTAAGDKGYYCVANQQ